jgi:hypothetical protein
MADNKIKAEDQKSLEELLTNMDATIYRLNLLCNRFEKDKDTILKENLELKQVIKSLKDEAIAFKEIRSEVNGVLADKIDEASKTIVTGANDKIQEMLVKDVKEVIYRLNDVLNQTEKKLLYFDGLDVRRIIYMALGILVVPIVAGICIAKIFMADPMLVFNKATCEIYKHRCAFIKK